MAGYLRPTTVGEALEALRGGRRTVLAGGTDIFPAQVGRAVDGELLDISALRELSGIADRGDHWRIGALATWSDVIAANLPPLFDGLKLAAREVGGVQIQNAATVCGNLCNASPAADGVPALLSLDAAVELAAADGAETLPLDRFITGNRRTVRGPDQLMMAVTVPKPAGGRTRGHFLKLGARRYLVISIAMVAATITVAEDRSVAAAAVAVGACSEVACRLPALEAALIGRSADGRLGAAATSAHLAALAPIDDVRGSAGYRRDAALTLVRRTLSELGART